MKIDGEPMFCGADVLHVLYGKANGIAHVYGSLDAEQVSKVKRVHLGMRPGKDATVIAESGLYRLVMRSDRPEAKGSPRSSSRRSAKTVTTSWAPRNWRPGK